jgi:hypothetical protein
LEKVVSTEYKENQPKRELVENVKGKVGNKRWAKISKALKVI